MSLDKQAHVLAGAVIALAMGYLLPPIYGAAAAGFAGAVKELYDSFHPATHTVDRLDFLATLAGGLIASLFVFLVTQ